MMDETPEQAAAVDQASQEFADALRARHRLPEPGARPEWQSDIDTFSVRLTLRTVPAHDVGSCACRGPVSALRTSQERP